MVKSSKNVAICAAFGAIQIIALLCAKYVEVATISFYAICAITLTLPLSQKMYKESALTYIAVSVLSFFLVGIPEAFVYLFVCGGFTLLSVFLYEKKVKLFISTPIKIIVANLILVFFFFLFRAFISIDLSKFNFQKGEITFVHYAIITTAIALLYDFFIIFVYKRLPQFTDRIFKR